MKIYGLTEVINGSLLINDGNVSIGTSTLTGQRFLVRGEGDTSATTTANFQSLSGISNLRIKDDGLIQIHTSTTAGVYNLISERTTSDDTIHSHAEFKHSFNPVSNGTGRTTGVLSQVFKQGNFNSSVNTAFAGIARIFGSGNVSFNRGAEFQATLTGTGTISYNFGAETNSLIQSTSTVTHHGGLRVRFEQNIAGSSVTNMYGIWINTPSNTGGSVTTTYGMRIDPNTIGTNNWGVYQVSDVVKNHFNGKVLIGTTTDSGDSKLKVNGDIEVIGNSNGQILPDRLGSGARVRIYAEKNVDTGVWSTFLEEVV